MTEESAKPTARPAGPAFSQYAGALHRFLARRLKRPQDVDDLAQEVFIRLLRLERPELVRKPQAYLFSVAANLVREFRIRADKEHEQLDYDSDAADEAADQPAQVLPDELAERIAIQQQLERALAQLPAMQRAVLLLVKRDGLSHKEVARKTGIHVRTVERYVMEATAKMLTMEWDR
jgi:RNA polymerase sigma-70 factor (ECF subfamily)